MTRRITVKKGEVWKITGRKGPMTIRFRGKVDFSKDDFFSAKIVSGKVRFVSDHHRMNQRLMGEGTAGTVESFRTTLVRLVRRQKRRG